MKLEIVLLFVFAYSCFCYMDLRHKPYHPPVFLSSMPNIEIFDEKIIQTALCEDFLQVAKLEIQTKNAVYCCVPGGSVLKLLAGLRQDLSLDWTKVHLFYVNHKCVEEDDPNSSHYKAKKLFLDEIGLLNAYYPSCNIESYTTAASDYEKKILEIVPKNNELPIFDYMLLGMGKDGHIGSLYPNRNQINYITPNVLYVDKKIPPSITLSLPVMNNAKNIRVVIVGEDKAEAVCKALISNESIQPVDFPAIAINKDKLKTKWMLDTGAAKLLQNYLSQNL